MNKVIGIFAILAIALAASMLLTPMVSAFPTIKRKLNFTEDTIEGGGPQTIDYSFAYDTASGEVVQNTMDTLAIFNGEHNDQYLPNIAESWTEYPLGVGGAGIDSGIPIAGLNFESAGAQPGPNATYYYRYDFKIVTADPSTGITNILFHPYPADYVGPAYSRNMTTKDIAYSFWRTMTQDRQYGPQWMLDEPLLDQAAGICGGLGGTTTLTSETQVAETGRLIESAVQYNNTDVMFNLMYPGAYAPFIQILCQTWASITSQAWTVNYAINQLGRNDWDGNWSEVSTTHPTWTTDHTGWIDSTLSGSTNPSPLDTPYPIAYGSGPFMLDEGTPDNVLNYWSMTRFTDYWRGWPADFPNLYGSQPAGYVDTVKVNFGKLWDDRKAEFLAGDCDFVAVPGPSYYSTLYSDFTNGIPLDGVRVIYPLFELVADAMYYVENISPGTYAGTIGTNNTFDRNNIPPDFFGNPTWGLNVRKALAYAFDYDSYINDVFLGEASHPATAIIPGIAYYDGSVPGFTYNLAQTVAFLNKVGPDLNGKYLNQTGFTLTIAYNSGNYPRQDAGLLLKSALEGLKGVWAGKITVNVVAAPWASYLTAMNTHALSMYIVGWAVDFPDAHDWALPFYASYGTYGGSCLYNNPTMDALITQGISTPDGPARQTVYTNIQKLAIEDPPGFMLVQPIGRHFERDWVVGYYYSSIYPGEFYYNRWKFYYIPEYYDGSATQPLSDKLPYDVNYDGIIDMFDIGLAQTGFLSEAFPTPTSYPLWVFRADVSNDRSIDSTDIGSMAAHYLQTSSTWNYTWASSP